MKSHIAMVLIGAIAVSGCGLSRNAQLRRAAVKALDQSDMVALTDEAKALWQREGKESFDIPEARWPESFRRFSPVRVFQDDFGICVVMGKFVSHTAGVYIVVKEDYTPKDVSNGTYEALSEGIYWALGS